MRRREFITLVGCAVAWPLAAHAQQRNGPLVGFMSSGQVATWQPYLVAFRRGLLDAGYIEGRNLTIDYRWAEGHVDRLPKLAAELAAKQPAVLVASGGNDPAMAAKGATATIPIVFTGAFDAVEFGLVTSLNRPGGNVTGMSILSADLYGKLIDLLDGAAPTARKYGVLLNPSAGTVDRIARAVENGARGRPVVAAQVESESGLDAAFASLVGEGVGALIVPGDARFNVWRDRIVALAAHHRLPAIYVWGEYVRAGGLMSYGPNLPDQYHQAATYVGRILKGESPADLPVTQPTKFDLIINLKTAKTLGFDLQPSVLALADEVSERRAIGGPGVHQLSTFAEQVPSPVGLLDFATDYVGHGPLDDLVLERRAFASPLSYFLAGTASISKASALLKLTAPGAAPL